jgi:hypothetical protein
MYWETPSPVTRYVSEERRERLGIIGSDTA